MNTDRATLTASYLDEVARRGESAADLLAVMPTTGILAAQFGNRFAARPLFIGHAEGEQVSSDLRHIKAAMTSLPDLLYDGDLAAFAKDSGLMEVQIEAALRTRTGQVTNWGRADMYPDEHGFRLMEFNMGSSVGGSDVSEINRAMLRYPLLREFAREHRLSSVDTYQEQIRLTLEESGFTRDSSAMIALIDWPAHYEQIGGYLHKISRRWRGIGLDAHAGHVGHLKVHDGRVWLRGRPVDVIFRIFMTEHLLEPGGAELIFPVLDAVGRGEVRMFTPLDSELYGSKAPLAMLSDHAHRHLFTSDQQAAIDRVLPWTRTMRAGLTTLEDGSTVNLMEYALAHPADLVLKPALLHGGSGVLAGWDSTEREWRDALNQAMGGPWVLQRRIRAKPEMYPGEVGELVPWDVHWGFFTSAAGFGGAITRSFIPRPGTMVHRSGTHVRYGGVLIGPPAAAAQ